MPAFDLPAACGFSITNVCNGACDFYGFARDKTLTGPARYTDAGAYSRALPILHRRRIRYLTLQGGEPQVHLEVVRLVSQTVAAGISCALITNGWFLSRYVKLLATAGLCQLIVSLDSDDRAQHKRNRGLDGLDGRFGRRHRPGAHLRPASPSLGSRQPPRRLWRLAEYVAAPEIR